MIQSSIHVPHFHLGYHRSGLNNYITEIESLQDSQLDFQSNSYQTWAFVVLQQSAKPLVVFLNFVSLLRPSDDLMISSVIFTVDEIKTVREVRNK